jgi:hypothetical protein
VSLGLPAVTGVTIDMIGESDFDVEMIDETTSLAYATGHEASPKRVKLKDVDHDGDIDLRLEFRAAELDIECPRRIHGLSTHHLRKDGRAQHGTDGRHEDPGVAGLAVALTAKTLSGETVAGAVAHAHRGCKH